MLTEEQIRQIENGVVERHRQLYSDDELWAMLDKRETRLNQIMELIPHYYMLASRDAKDYKLWKAELDRLSREYAAALPVVELIVWHLEKRGLTEAAKWREGWEDHCQASARGWWQKPWGIEQ